MECVLEEQSLVQQPLRGPLFVLVRPLAHAQVMHQNAQALEARFLFLIQVIHFIRGHGGGGRFLTKFPVGVCRPQFQNGTWHRWLDQFLNLPNVCIL